MRRIAFAVGLLVLAGALATSVGAVTSLGTKTIVGTAKSDVLRGTPKADVINGKAGNDKLYGYAGNDVLIGGPGNDLLVGGPGRDSFRCGPRTDTVMADAQDARPGKDCELVKGLPKPALSISSDASASEGNSGTTTFSLPVELSAASTQAVSVSFATADGTANAPSDYQAASGTVTFRPGETSKTIDVVVVGDTTFEPDETFTVTLSNPANATIADRSADGTIQNDDQPPPPAQPGHYEGTTSQLTRFAFDVTPAGTRVTGLITGQINQSCSPGGSLYGGNLRFGSYSVPVSADGSFTIDVIFQSRVDSEPSTNHVIITGRFSGGIASGTLLETISFTYQGTQFSCTSNPQTWNATRTS